MKQFISACLFFVTCILPLDAATVFIGGLGADIGIASNWSNGLPTQASPGEIDGIHSTVYSSSTALSNLKLTLKDNATLTGKEARVTDGTIVLEDSAQWTDTSKKGVILGHLAGSLNETQMRIRGLTNFHVTKGKFVIGNKQKSRLLQSGGFVHVAKKLTIGNRVEASGSLYQISAGSAHIEQDVIIKNDSILQIKGSGAMQVDGKLSINDSDSRLRIRDQANLHVNGNVTLDNSGAKIWQIGGDMVIDSNLSLNKAGGSGSAYVLKGGQLSVKDTIKVSGNNVFIWKTEGVIAVHTEGSYVDYDGDLTAQSGAVLDLNGKTEYLDVSGTLTLNGLEIKGYDLLLYQYANTDGSTVETGCHLLVEAGTLIINTVTFTDFTDSIGTRIDMGDLFDPQTDTVYWFDSTTDPQRINVCWSVASVPEPSSLAYSLIFPLTLLFLRRR